MISLPPHLGQAAASGFEGTFGSGMLAGGIRPPLFGSPPSSDPTVGRRAAFQFGTPFSEASFRPPFDLRFSSHVASPWVFEPGASSAAEGKRSLCFLTEQVVEELPRPAKMRRRSGDTDAMVRERSVGRQLEVGEASGCDAEIIKAATSPLRNALTDFGRPGRPGRSVQTGPPALPAGSYSELTGGTNGPPRQESHVVRESLGNHGALSGPGVWQRPSPSAGPSSTAGGHGGATTSCRALVPFLDLSRRWVAGRGEEEEAAKTPGMMLRPSSRSGSWEDGSETDMDCS